MNASKEVYFDKEETLQGYYHVIEQILSRYGIPYEILTDRRTIFEYTKIKSPKLYEDTFTNFSYVPQAKGQIERAFGYWHDRFPPEARLANINHIQEANLLLTKMDMRKINNGHCLSYKKQYYQLQDQYQTPIYLKRKTIVNVIETFNGDLYATFNDELFLLKRVNKKDIISKAFDIVANKKTIHRKVDTHL